MDERCLVLAEGYCSKPYVDSGRENLHSLHRIIRSILAQRRCPEVGLSDLMIEHLLTQLALMDANNFHGHIGGGEREGRVVAPMVQRRHFGLSHGVGRSGNLTEHQPKAAGSSILYQVTNTLVLDLLRLSGATSLKAALCVPMATGMTIALVLRAVAKAREKELRRDCGDEDSSGVDGRDGPHGMRSGAKPVEMPRIVIFPRIDQKTALKCIDAAGFEAEVVELRPAPLLFDPNCRSSDLDQSSTTSRHHATGTTVLPASLTTPHCTHPLFLQVHVDDIAAAVKRVGGPHRVLCILSTTSCFAPRLPDDVVSIARYAKSEGIPYVINNAYGVQSAAIMKRIEVAQREHRVDYIVQSGDKNFLVPVGGAVVASNSAERVQLVAQVYAGRASGAPITDLFITALHLGREGMRGLWSKREATWVLLVERLRVFARERGEMLLLEEMSMVLSPSSSTVDDQSQQGGQLLRSSTTKRSGDAAQGKEKTTEAKEKEEPTSQSISKFKFSVRPIRVVGDKVAVTLPPRSSGPGKAGGPKRSCSPKTRAAERSVFPRNDISIAITMQRFGIESEVPTSRMQGEWLVNDEAGDPARREGGERGKAQQEEEEKEPSAMKSPKQDPRENHAYSSLVENLESALVEKRRAACAEFGAKLFRSRVTGPRVILPAPQTTSTICGKYRFHSYGCHEEAPKCPLLVVACGIGMNDEEVHQLILAMTKLWPVMEPNETSA